MVEKVLAELKNRPKEMVPALIEFIRKLGYLEVAAEAERAHAYVEQSYTSKS